MCLPLFRHIKTNNFQGLKTRDCPRFPSPVGWFSRSCLTSFRETFWRGKDLSIVPLGSMMLTQNSTRIVWWTLYSWWKACSLSSYFVMYDKEIHTQSHKHSNLKSPCLTFMEPVEDVQIATHKRTVHLPSMVTLAALHPSEEIQKFSSVHSLVRDEGLTVTVSACQGVSSSLFMFVLHYNYDALCVDIWWHLYVYIYISVTVYLYISYIETYHFRIVCGAVASLTPLVVGHEEQEKSSTSSMSCSWNLNSSNKFAGIPNQLVLAVLAALVWTPVCSVIPSQLKPVGH